METLTPELITIPYEATEIRAAAKDLGARWRSATKQWALPTAETAATIREQIAAFEGSSSITVRRIHSEEETDLSRGAVLWEDGAWVTIERTERHWCDPDDGDCNSMFNRGFHYTYHCRPATEAEYAELYAAKTGRDRKAAEQGNALAAAEALESEAKAAFSKRIEEPAKGSEQIYELRPYTEMGLWWLIEPEDAAGRRVIYIRYDAVPAGWTEPGGNFGDASKLGYPLPWTAEREAIIRAAGIHWDANSFRYY